MFRLTVKPKYPIWLNNKGIPCGQINIDAYAYVQAYDSSSLAITSGSPSNSKESHHYSTAELSSLTVKRTTKT